MKLSTISLACWLAGFYALFQSFLNGLAEIMRFGDREFYTDWWNVSSIRAYWTNWNRPVYHFMKGHVYMPMVARGVPAGSRADHRLHLLGHSVRAARRRADAQYHR